MIAALLLRNGFESIQLKKNKVGHFQTIVRINGIPAIFLVDTGAASTVIDIDFAREIGLPIVETSLKGGGVGSSQVGLYEVKHDILSLGEKQLHRLKLYGIDFTHVKQALKMKGETSYPAGVLGADALFLHHAIIDYGNGCMYLN